MEMLADLWLPIVLSAVFVFIASFLTWAVLPFHRKELKGVPDEAAVRSLLAEKNIPPGQYMIPYCDDPSKMKDPEYRKRMETGPIGLLHIWNGRRPMGLCMLGTFIFFLVTSFFVAYLATVALGGEEPAYLDVFQVTGTAALLAYCFGFIPTSIWFGRPLSSTVLEIIDGIVYALLTAGTFGWLWPGATG